MKKVFKRITAAITAALSTSSVSGNTNDNLAKTSLSVAEEFDRIQFSQTVNSAPIPRYLAAHSSHSSHGSHGSHGSHRSSSTAPRRPATPSYIPISPPAKAVTKPKKESDPLGQEPKPKDTFRPAIPDASELSQNLDKRKDVIRRIQLQLQLLNIYTGALDGIMGPETRAAIDLYKIKKGLPRGGYLDKSTLDAFGILINP